MYLPVFKADKGGERVRESLGRGTGCIWGWGWKSLFLSQCWCLRASLGLISYKKYNLFLDFGGEEPQSEGYKLVFRCYKALLGWVGYFACKEDRTINVFLFHFGDRTKKKRACVESKGFSSLTF